MNLDSHFKIGLIMKPHGLKGEVTITLDDDFVNDITELESVFILEKNNSLIPFFIEAVSVNGSKAFIKFEDIDTPEDALKISKKAIYLPKSLRPKAGKGQFYDDEIKGFEVTDETAGVLGPVTDVFQTGANRLLVVDFKGKEILIPTNGPLISSINKSKQKIIVNLPDGFLDI
ncbi:MAG TPA: ribosome maturation factor RimM [Cyclobacteriaceae bacterium]|nr:ribosome maturation factor RimM [Cyclobacteriaceae bacterium]